MNQTTLVLRANQMHRDLRQALTPLTALQSLDVFDALPSTNTWLAEQTPPAVGKAHAAIALHQTAGRGRRGKRWQAPAESGLCLSVAYTMTSMPARPAALTLALGVTVARVLEQLGVGEVMLKWPNDIVWQDRKLGGILVETTTGEHGFRVIAGMGINVALPEDFRLDDDSRWADGVVDLTSAGAPMALTPLAEALIPEVIACMASYNGEALQDTIDAFNRRHWLQDRAAEQDGQMLRCGAVDHEGRLRAVNMSDGAMHKIDSGDVMPLAWSRAS